MPPPSVELPAMMKAPFSSVLDTTYTPVSFLGSCKGMKSKCG